MNFGVFESAVSDGYEDRVQKSKVSKALDKASRESVKKVGAFIFEATSKKDLEDRLALCEDDVREICSNFLNASNAYVAVRDHLIERHADHWRSNPDFLHFLVEMYGTIEVSDQQLIEALEEFACMPPPPGDFDSPLEDAPDFVEQPKIENFSARREARRRKGSLDPVDSKLLAKYANSRLSTSGWRLDVPLSAYVSSSKKAFSCHCGAKLDVPGYHNCKCGKIWNGYKISSKDGQLFVVREVPVRDGVVLAKRKTASTIGDVLKSFGWKPVDTAQEDWESPGGLVTFFGVQELIMAWDPDDNEPVVEEDTSNMSTGDIVKKLMELSSYYG